MFERFTERSRNTIALAQNEAGRLKHDYVGTGHLLVGLLQIEDGMANDVLSSSGVSTEAARSRLERISGFGEKDVSAKPFTRSAKRVFEKSSETALEFGENYVGVDRAELQAEVRSAIRVGDR